MTVLCIPTAEMLSSICAGILVAGNGAPGVMTAAVGFQPGGASNIGPTPSRSTRLSPAKAGSRTATKVEPQPAPAITLKNIKVLAPFERIAGRNRIVVVRMIMATYPLFA